MSQNIEESARDTYRFGQFDFEIHDMIENRNDYPIFPYVLNLPIVLFNQSQFQNYMTRYYQMLRGFEIENMFNFPQNSVPYSVFCGYCHSVHIIDTQLNQSSMYHLSTGVVVTPFWSPFTFRPTLQIGDNLQRQE